MSFISDYENKLAAFLERNLNETKIRLWADVFANENTTKQNSILLLGHQKTERIGRIVNPSTGFSQYTKRIRFEIRAETYTLQNHHECLELIELALDFLDGYRPFYEFLPFVSVESGDVRRNPSSNSWIYSASGYTELSSVTKQLTPIYNNSDLGNPKIVKVGLINAQDEKTIGTLIKEES